MANYKIVNADQLDSHLALVADSIRSKEPVCYEDLGTEAVCRLEVEDFYAIVGIDAQGNSVL